MGLCDGTLSSRLSTPAGDASNRDVETLFPSQTPAFTPPPPLSTHTHTHTKRTPNTRHGDNGSPSLQPCQLTSPHPGNRKAQIFLWGSGRFGAFFSKEKAITEGAKPEGAPPSSIPLHYVDADKKKKPQLKQTNTHTKICTLVGSYSPTHTHTHTHTHTLSLSLSLSPPTCSGCTLTYCLSPISQQNHKNTAQLPFPPPTFSKAGPSAGCFL